MEKPPIQHVDHVSEKSASEKAADERKLLDLLNRARQGHVEYGDIYSHVFGRGTNTGTEYPDFLVHRADLIEKFAVGKNGEPYTSTHQAAHDMVEYLVEEAEDTLKEVETDAKIEGLHKKIDVEKDFLTQLNLSRQQHTEISDIYNYVFKKESGSGTKYPEFLLSRDDLVERFAVGKNGEPYASTSEAAHDMVEHLAKEVTDVIRALEAQLHKIENKKRQEQDVAPEINNSEPISESAPETVETRMDTPLSPTETASPVETNEKNSEDSSEIPPNLETGIPMMVTKKMRLDLQNLGMKNRDIDKLRPKDAWDILNKQTSRNKTPESEPVKAPEETFEKGKAIEFTTEKGSVYKYFPHEKTKRFETSTGESMEAEDICVFIPPWNKLSMHVKKVYPEIFSKINSELDFEQLLLTYTQPKDYTIEIIDGSGKEFTKNSDVATAHEVFIALVDLKNPKNSFALPASKEPKIGYSTYDSHIYEENGQRMKTRHIGNKVVDIKYSE